MGGSGAQKPGDDPEPFLVPDAADRRHAGKDVLDGSGLGPRVLTLLMEPLRVYWQNDSIKALAWDMQFRGQVNMPYNALKGLPGCFPSHYLRRKAGEYALGSPPEGPVLPSEFRGWEVPGVP